MSIRIIIADDHPVVLMGIRALFQAQGGNVDIVAEAFGGRELLATVARIPCDVVITDFSMPDPTGVSDGFPMLRHLQREHPELPVIVLTMVHNPSLIQGMLAVGVRGIIDKSALTRELLQAVQTVHAGRIYRNERQRTEGSSNGHLRTAESAMPSLSPREAEVVRLFVGGLSVTQIAEQLHRSVKTISQQKNDAMRKLGLASHAHLYEFAKNFGLVS